MAGFSSIGPAVLARGRAPQTVRVRAELYVPGGRGLQIPTFGSCKSLLSESADPYLRSLQIPTFVCAAGTVTRRKVSIGDHFAEKWPLGAERDH